MNFLNWVHFASLTMSRCSAFFVNFYKIAVRPAMIYGTECWAVKKKYILKMSVAEMRKLIYKER